jgi:hypothetical protein
MTSEHLIRRYEHNYFRGWVVSAKRRGRRWVRYFSDRPHGRAKALGRARAYRRELLEALPLPTKIKRRYVRNTTGVIGVARVKERTRSGNWMLRYVATWPSPTNACRSAKATFSVALYGEAGAKRRAVRARQKGVAEFLSTGPARRVVARVT